MEILSVALGSSMGAVARFALGQVALRAGLARPYLATLAINLVGCLAAGFLLAAVGPRGTLEALLVTGFLASFTTVSAFSLEALLLWQAGRLAAAVGYVSGSVVGCLLLAFVGRAAGKCMGVGP